MTMGVAVGMAEGVAIGMSAESKSAVNWFLTGKNWQPTENILLLLNISV